MILFDTDMFTIAQYPRSAAGSALQGRLSAHSSEDSAATTIITYEEQTRGWFAVMARARKLEDQVKAYERFYQHLLVFRRTQIVRFDERAASTFENLFHMRLKIGTMDLKIAAIALVNDALLLSRNLQHFSRVPGLRVEDWTQ